MFAAGALADDALAYGALAGGAFGGGAVEASIFELGMLAGGVGFAPTAVAGAVAPATGAR